MQNLNVFATLSLKSYNAEHISEERIWGKNPLFKTNKTRFLSLAVSFFVFKVCPKLTDCTYLHLPDSLRRDSQLITNLTERLCLGITIEIKPAEDLGTDLLRRDFTINTFAVNSNGEFVDLLGSKRDLDQRLIKVVGDTF